MRIVDKFTGNVAFVDFGCSSLAARGSIRDVVYWRCLFVLCSIYLHWLIGSVSLGGICLLFLMRFLVIFFVRVILKVRLRRILVLLLLILFIMLLRLMLIDIVTAALLLSVLHIRHVDVLGVFLIDKDIRIDEFDAFIVNSDFDVEVGA